MRIYILGRVYHIHSEAEMVAFCAWAKAQRAVR